MTDDLHHPRPYGQALDAHLARGGVLEPVEAAIDLDPGERCFGIGSGKLLHACGPDSWQVIDRGLIHVTGRRVLVDGARGRTEIDLSRVVRVVETPLLVELAITESDDMALVLPYPDYWRVLIERVRAGVDADQGPEEAVTASRGSWRRLFKRH